MNFIRELKKNSVLFLMALPALVCLIVFNYLPMFGVILAFKDYNYTNGILKSPWVKFKNFEFLFTNNDAWIITRNTLLYNTAFIIITLVVSVGLAIIFNEIRNRTMAKVYQTIAIMPYFLSWVVVGFVAFGFFSVDKGYLNNLLVHFGKEPISWYAEPKFWPYILIFINTWKSIGYNSVVYLAAISGISNEYYEAAVLDGASKWQQIRRITLPFLKPMIIIMVILSIGKIFYADFGLFYNVPRDSGQLYSVTQVIDTYVYIGLRNIGNVGMSAASNFYQSVVGFTLVLASNLAVKKIDKDYALF